MNTRIALRSIGCRTNQEEMTALGYELRRAGFLVSDSVADVDIVIVNSCCVTGCTESKTRRLLRSISRAAPNARIMVTGCLAQHQPQELLSQQEVHWVVGNTRKTDICGILDRAQGGVFHTEMQPDLPVPEPPAPGEPLLSARTRYPVKIQEGCDFRCAYCIVPLVRGPSRSVALDTVLSAVRKAVESGFKEVVLTGTHIGQYRAERCHGIGELLEHVLRIEGDFRVRLSSIDARELGRDLVGMVGEQPRVCDHLHVSVQSLSPDVLTAMGRGATDVDSLLERLSEVHELCPDCSLGGDFIVGFPGESESMFEQTCEAVERAGFTYGHVFRYSPRPGTRASTMPDQVPGEIKKQRAARLRELLARRRTAFVAGQKGTRLRIVVERQRPVRGLTSNFLHVRLDTASAPRNTWLDVELSGEVADDGRYCMAQPAGDRA